MRSETIKKATALLLSLIIIFPVFGAHPSYASESRQTPAVPAAFTSQLSAPLGTGAAEAAGTLAGALISGSPSASTNNYLASLKVSFLSITPAFDRATSSYTVYVPQGTDIYYLVKAKTEDSKAALRVAYSFGAVFEGAQLTDKVSITVTSESGAARDYVLNVVQRDVGPSPNNWLYQLIFITSPFCSLTPGFDPEVSDYSVTVPYEVSTCSLMPMASDEKATVEPFGFGYLTAGTVTNVGCKVTSRGGSVRTYTIKVYRESGNKSSDNRLSSLSASQCALSPAFSSDRLEYSASVPYEVTKLDLSWNTTDANAAVTVSGNSLAADAVTRVTVSVRAENGDTRNYVINTARAAARSSENRLSSLSAAGLTLSPAFSPEQADYSVSVPNEMTRLDLTWKAYDSKAAVSVTGNTLAAGAVTKVTVTVTAENGAARIYVISASRAAAKSSDNRLSSLSAAGCTLSPSFSPDQLDYSVSVPNEMTRLDLTWKAYDSKAAVSVTGNTLTAGAVTKVTVTVTAENGTARNYVISATRAAAKSSENRLSSLSAAGCALSPAFSPDRLEYAASVPYETAKLDLTWKTHDSKAAVIVTGNNLAAGAVTKVTLTVSAENGAARYYVINVTRAAAKSSENRLSSLSAAGCVLSPAFSPDRFEYAASVPYEADKLDLSWKAYDAKASVSVTGNVLTAGAQTKVTLTVRAENGDARYYVINVTRAQAKSSENRLTSLSAGVWPLTPSFSPEKLEYSVIVPNPVTKLDLSWKAFDSKSAVSVSGNSLAAGAVTRVTVTVRAENGEARSYIIKVTREQAKPSENRLSSLSAGKYAIIPSFSPERLEYSLSVGRDVKKLVLSWVAVDPASVVTVTGADLAETGSSVVRITVTAQDGSVRVYTLKVTRTEALDGTSERDCALSSLTPSAGALFPEFSAETLDYSVRLESGQGELELFAVASDPQAEVVVAGPAMFSGGTQAVYTVTVTSVNGAVRVYTVTAFSSGSLTDPLEPGEGQSWSPDSPMVISASALNTLFRSPGSFLILSNAVGQVKVDSGMISSVALSYYDLTLAYSTRHDLSGIVPDGCLVVSTAYEGVLFGDVEFRIFTDLAGPLNVYCWDPDASCLIAVASDVKAGNGYAAFSFGRAGTFVITGRTLSASGDPGAAPLTGILDGYSKLLITVLALGFAFTAAYLTGASRFSRSRENRRSRA